MTENKTITKITPVEYPILESIKNRWSPREFADTPITEENVNLLLEAGRWAPSTSNMQPWRVIWGIKGTEMFDRIYECLDDYNKQWAGNAQVLWLNAFKKTMNDGKKEYFHALHDLGLFMGNVIQQASSMGIAVHQMAGIRFKDALKEFGFPEDYHVATGVAFGYYGGEVNNLPEALRDQEMKEMRIRKTQDQFAFNGNFQNTNENMDNKKKHADFQDEYRKSSNFGKDKDEENLEVIGNGKLKVENPENDKNSKDTKSGKGDRKG